MSAVAVSFERVGEPLLRVEQLLAAHLKSR
jgi:hypothetical protein